MGKKSWNVYNPANIARVKADEAAAAAREAADEQRMQELDAERRAAILRGQTPPPLPQDNESHDKKSEYKSDRPHNGHNCKRRRLANEDDTDRDIRLARTVTEPARDDDDRAVLKLRKPEVDTPLTDHAGNINLFPVDVKEVVKREKNAEAEKEKKRKERALEDQYTMRLANAAGNHGRGQPWYLGAQGNGGKQTGKEPESDAAVDESGFGNKDVWGNEDPLRKERQKARILSSDPLAFMNQAQTQLKRARQERKKWAEEREKELMELRAAQEREERRHRHRHSRHNLRADVDSPRSSRREKEPRQRGGDGERDRDRERSSRDRHHPRKRSRSRSPDTEHRHRSSRRRSQSRSRNRSREKDRDRRDRDRDRSHDRERDYDRSSSHQKPSREDRHRRDSDTPTKAFL